MNIIKRKDYRLVVISDLHCGHQVGICGPEYFGQFVKDDIAKHNKFLKIQKAVWKFYSDEISKLNREKQIELLVIGGDAIDGRGEKSGSTELTTSDRYKQVAIAKNVIDFIKAKHITVLCGTNYHVSNGGEDWEEVLADQLGAKFESHCFLDIHSTVFDIKHHLSSSGGVMGNYGSIAKEVLYSKLWQELDLVPKPVKYLIRSHVHRYSYIENSTCAAMTTPALCGMGSKYGARKCSGLVDLGFVHFDIKSNGDVTMGKHIAILEEQKAKATVYS